MDSISNKITFRHALAQWYAGAQRPLPWRTQPSLYRTVVSELMAQQTQIKTMLPYSEPKPHTREAWQKLPGIGPYTSAAISSIALGEPAAVVDGNVVRILARLTNDRRVFKNNGAAVKAFTPTADEVLDSSSPGQHNQAMMELGATVCLKHKPLCTVCPVVTFCAATQAGTQDELPKIERKASVQVAIDRAWIVKGGKLLLHRIPDSSSQLAGQYELPKLSEVTTAKVKKQLLLSKSRSITHHRIKEHIYETTAKQSTGDCFEWLALDDLASITLSGPHRRWIGELLTKFDASK